VRISIGDKQLILFEYAKPEVDQEVPATTTVVKGGTFDYTCFYHCKGKEELIGLMVACGLMEERDHARNWMNGKMGGYGDFDKAKRRAAGFYKTKFKITA
jgi:hypothetical protein